MPEIQTSPIALDISLERARALHRVWRALNDGDCPKCHHNCTAQGVIRNKYGDMKCPNCKFEVKGEEVTSIEVLFAPAMDAALAIFDEWRKSREAVKVPLTFEVGKRYLTRSGDVARIYALEGNNCNAIHGAVYSKSLGWFIMTWTPEGKVSHVDPGHYGYDLVAEFSDPAPSGPSYKCNRCGVGLYVSGDVYSGGLCINCRESEGPLGF